MYHIGFCGGENYIKFIAAAMYSIAKNTNAAVSYKDKLPYAIVENQENAEEKYFFHIMTDCLSAATVQKISCLEKELNAIFPCSIEIHYVSDDVFKNYPRWRGNYMTYYRLLYPQILPDDVKHFLYLDGDILVISDIRDIFCEDLENYTVGAVAQYQLDIKKLQKKILAPKQKGEKAYSYFTHKYYFCAGVLLINIEKWKEENVEEKFFWFLNKFHAKYPDQDALNYAFKNNFKVLDFKYNMYMAGVDKEYVHDAERQLRQYGIVLNKYEDPCVVHYMLKPWKTTGWGFTNSTVYYNKYIPLWWEYAEKIPCFADDLMAVLQSENYKQCAKYIEERKQRYKKFRYFYWLRKWFSLYKGQIAYWINSLK